MYTGQCLCCDVHFGVGMAIMYVYGCFLAGLSYEDVEMKIPVCKKGKSKGKCGARNSVSFVSMSSCK